MPRATTPRARPARPELPIEACAKADDLAAAELEEDAAAVVLEAADIILVDPDAVLEAMAELEEPADEDDDDEEDDEEEDDEAPATVPPVPAKV